MTTALMQSYLLCSLLINYGILLAWFLVFRYAHDWLYGIHGRWFQLSQAHFDALHYGGMTIYKVGILLLNLVPFIALHLVNTAAQAAVF